MDLNRIQATGSHGAPTATSMGTHTSTAAATTDIPIEVLSPLERLPPELLHHIACLSARVECLRSLASVNRRLRKRIRAAAVMKQFLLANSHRMEVRLVIVTPKLGRFDELYFGTWLRQGSATSSRSIPASDARIPSIVGDERPVIIHQRKPIDFRDPLTVAPLHAVDAPASVEELWIYSFAVNLQGRVQTEKICLTPATADGRCLADALRRANAREEMQRKTVISPLVQSSPVSDLASVFETRLSVTPPVSPIQLHACAACKVSTSISDIMDQSSLRSAIHSFRVSRTIDKNHPTFFSNWNDDHSFTFLSGQRLSILLDYNRRTSAQSSSRHATRTRNHSPSSSSPPISTLVGYPMGSAAGTSHANWWLEMDAPSPAATSEERVTNPEAEVGRWGWWYRVDQQQPNPWNDATPSAHKYREGDIFTEGVYLDGIQLTTGEMNTMDLWMSLV